MICSNCGNELEDGSMFCTKCGMKQVNAGTMPAVPNMVQMPGMDGNPGEAGGAKKIKMPKKPDFSKLPRFEEIVKDKKKVLTAAVPAGAVLLILIVLLVVKIAGGNKLKIDSFREFKWGTSYEKVLKKVITEDMEEGYDYYIDDSDEDEGEKGLVIEDASVGGYEATVSYGFWKDKLLMGVYELDDSDNYKMLLEKYKIKYGNPTITGVDNDVIFYVWIDSDKNMIILSSESIAYMKFNREFMEKSGGLDAMKVSGIDLDNPENGYRVEGSGNNNYEGI